MTARPSPPTRRYRPTDDFPWDTFLSNLAKLIERGGGRAEFAAASGISFWTIGGWFRQSHVPRVDNLLAIRSLYGVPLDTLLFNTVR